jgi:hypothetical protein
MYVGWRHLGRRCGAVDSLLTSRCGSDCHTGMTQAMARCCVCTPLASAVPAAGRAPRTQPASRAASLVAGAKRRTKSGKGGGFRNLMVCGPWKQRAASRRSLMGVWRAAGAPTRDRVWAQVVLERPYGCESDLTHTPFVPVACVC